jgi:AcrR family transcriptional regulator
MSPRAYRMGQRETATEATRQRIISAAHELLAREEGFTGFSLEAVARQAGVARVTVYYQFESRRQLLEANFDSMAEHGLRPLIEAMGRPDPMEALDGLIEAFAGFWASDRLAVRRIRGLAAIDPEVGASHDARDERRRLALTAILRRMHDDPGWEATLDERVNVLQMLTSFQAIDALARDRSPVEVVPVVKRLARAVLADEQSTSPG